MKKYAKKLIPIILVLTILVSAASVSFFSSAAYDKYLGMYVPSAGVETYTYYFAMPGEWTNDTTESQDNACGIYWWGGDDKPDEVPAANGHGWPGWKMKNDDTIENLRSVQVPKNVPMIIFNNYIDGGMDVNAPEFKTAKNTIDFGCEYFYQGDSDYYSKAFWDYLYDNYEEDFWDDPNFEIPEFGDYAKNFFYSEGDDNIGHTADNMVFVADLDPSTIKMSYTIVPEGMPVNNGAFYFYYGNGEFGLWPTKELLTEHEGVKFDDQGNVITEGETLNDYDFITRKGIDAYDQRTERDFVVYGNITGKYWDFGSQDDQNNPATYDEASPNDDIQPTTIDINYYPSGNKIYFYADPNIWKNYKQIYCYLYEHGGDEIITWGSKIGAMSNEGNNIWSLDLDAKGITLQNGRQYGIIFSADWGIQTCDLIMDRSCIGDIAFCPGNTVEYNVDSNKRSYWVWWNNADPTKYAPPLCFTSIGNIIGYANWSGTTNYSLLVNFIKSNGSDGLKNAIRFNGKTEQQTLDDAAEQLGLTQDDIERAIRESGRTDINWRKSYSPPSFSDDVNDAADYLLRYSQNPKMITPRRVKELFSDLEVSCADVKKALFFRCDGDYEKYEPALAALERADSEHLDITKGDVNNDGVVDILDATWIQKLAVGKITSFDDIS